MFLFPLTGEQLAYLAGFIDADGSIMCTIVNRQDYYLKYQIKVSLSFTQRKDKTHFLKNIQDKELGGRGCFQQDRGDGIGDLTLTGQSDLLPFLRQLRPYLRLKQKQADLSIRVYEGLSRVKDPEKFLELCELSDQVRRLNTSPNNLSVFDANAPKIRQEFLTRGLLKS